MLNSEMDKILAQTAGQVLEAPAKESGKQLTLLIDLIFTPFQVAKIYKNAWFKDYKKRIYQKFNQIPNDQFKEPPLNIIGPALEASKYYIATEEMREMFANLIVHACDQQMEPTVHPSFINILTQMSSIEASILSSFRPKQELKMGIYISSTENGQEKPYLDADKIPGTGIYSFPEQIQPIVNYYLAKENEQLLVQGNVIKSDITDNEEEIAAAITNLIRLGLLETSFQMQVADKGKYDYFSTNKLYQTLYKDVNPGNQVFMRSIRGNMIWGGQYNEIKVEKGIVRLTQFGYNFIKVCVLEKEVITEHK